MESLPLPEAEREEAERVAAWLARRPRFLAERPSLFRALEPPRRVHGERLADHMAAMLAAERRAVLDAARAARGAGALMGRVQRAVLALVGAPRDPAGSVAAAWPALLGLESVALLREGAPSRHWRDLAPGATRRLLPPGHDRRLREARDVPAAELATLHGEAAALVSREALLRLPGRRLLVLGARDPALLPRRGSGAALGFLAAAAAAALFPDAEP